MDDPRLRSGAQIDLLIEVPAFPTRETAHRVDWSRKVNLPPGKYVILESGYNADQLSSEAHSNGRYYEIAGPARGWVRQNYLLAGQHSDWPWDLTRCLEPIAWSEAWDRYLRDRVEGADQLVRTSDAPSSAPPLPDPAGGKAPAGQVDDKERCDTTRRSPDQVIDEFGAHIARAEDLLPHFDDAFDIQ